METRSKRSIARSTFQLLLPSLNKVFTNLLTYGLALSVFCQVRKAMDLTFGLGQCVEEH